MVPCEHARCTHRRATSLRPRGRSPARGSGGCAVGMDEALRDRWLTHADSRLSGPGRRSGAARTAVVELLAREAQCLLTAQEIIDRLRPGGAGSPASVYRTLDELFEL